MGKDQPELASDVRFESDPKRNVNHAVRNAPIPESFGHLNSEEVLARLDSGQIAIAHMSRTAGLWKHPQLQDRDRRATGNSPAGSIPALLAPSRPSAFEYRMGRVPAIGEHTESILRAMGRREGDLDALRSPGAI